MLSYAALIVLKVRLQATFAFCLRLLQRKVRLLRFQDAPLAGDEAVDASWLTRLLRKRGVIAADNSVQEVVVSLLGGHRGLTGSIYRLQVTYSQEQAQNVPATFVMKTSNDSITARVDNIVGGRPREVYLYDNFMRGPLAEITPRVLYTNCDRTLGEYVVIMEDLTLQEGLGANMLFGNQIWGVSEEAQALISRHALLQDKRAMLQAIFGKMAAFHANYWRDPSLLFRPDFKNVQWYHGADEVWWTIAIERSRSCWTAAQKRTDFELSPKLVSIINESLKQSSWQKLQAHLHDPQTPFTLCHGDFHASNMYVSLVEKDGQQDVKLNLYDWSEVGPWEPCTDLSQMFISDIPHHLFKELAEPVMRHYWETLISKGAPAVSAEDFPFERCWEAFCRGGAERWIFLFPIMTSFPQLPGSCVQYFHDQLLAFIEAFGDRPYYVLKPVVCLA